MFTSEEMTWLEVCPENDRREIHKTLGEAMLTRVVDRRPSPNPVDQTISFHTAWGEAKDRDDYFKADWKGAQTKLEDAQHTMAEWLLLVYGMNVWSSDPLDRTKSRPLAKSHHGRMRFKLSSTSGRIPPHPLAFEDKGYWITFGSLEELFAWIRSLSKSVVVNYVNGYPELDIRDDERY